MDIKNLIFNAKSDSDRAEEFTETAKALKDLSREYRIYASAVKAAGKQLLKFDEINRLDPLPDPKTVAARGSSSKTSAKQSPSPTTDRGTEETPVPTKLQLAVKDVLFSWTDLNREQIVMKLLAGFTALSGAIAGGIVGGVPGAVLGLGLGLAFGILLDSLIFNFDGELSDEELRKTILSALPIAGGGIVGLLLGGPVGAAIGITLGLVLSFLLQKLDGSQVSAGITEFLTDLRQNWSQRWENFRTTVQDLWDSFRRWWGGLGLPQFPFRLPHLQVSWQELASDSILSRFLGISAIPHLSVAWYARGGIVDGATLIGAGEQGKEAIIPLERNTEWIRSVASELRIQLEAAPLPVSLIPPAALQQKNTPPDFSGLAAALASVLAPLVSAQGNDPVIRVYLDGKQLSDAVTRYQRRASRANG